MKQKIILGYAAFSNLEELFVTDTNAILRFHRLYANITMPTSIHVNKSVTDSLLSWYVELVKSMEGEAKI